MARVLYFPDGTREVVMAGSDRDGLKNVLRSIIEERLGCECAELFDEVNGDFQASQGDDYEAIADGYLQMLNSVVDELDAIIGQFDAKRVNRDKLWKSLCQLRNSVNKNL